MMQVDYIDKLHVYVQQPLDSPRDDGIKIEKRADKMARVSRMDIVHNFYEKFNVTSSQARPRVTSVNAQDLVSTSDITGVFLYNYNEMTFECEYTFDSDFVQLIAGSPVTMRFCIGVDCGKYTNSNSQPIITLDVGKFLDKATHQFVTSYRDQIPGASPEDVADFSWVLGVVSGVVRRVVEPIKLVFDIGMSKNSNSGGFEALVDFSADLQADVVTVAAAPQVARFDPLNMLLRNIDDWVQV